MLRTDPQRAYVLWTCLYFPDLPVDVIDRTQADARALAVTHRHGSAHLIVGANRSARQQGIKQGMPVAAALALAPALRLSERNGRREAQALRQIAVWAGQFSPHICLSPPGKLLVETGASQRLFGGCEQLMRSMKNEAVKLGYGVHIAQAPTPAAAELLACRQDGGLIDRLEALPTALADVPIGSLALEAEMITALQRAGLRRLADCLQLPRAAMSQRLGTDCTRYLDRLLGRESDLRHTFDLPPNFQSRIELEADVIHSEALLFAIRRMLLELGGALRARDAAAEALHLRLEHADAPPARLSIGLLEPGARVDHLVGLVRERLERLQLTAPVRAIELTTPRFTAATHPASDLFERQIRGSQSWQQLVDKMRARLGAEAVFAVTANADHRPERAWRKITPGEATTGTAAGHSHRPLWLLDPPKPLPTAPSKESLETGPERIESGWWNGGVRRDYFVMYSDSGERWWIYRDGQSKPRWFVHGLFT